jgi:hypothetical protein
MTVSSEADGVVCMSMSNVNVGYPQSLAFKKVAHLIKTVDVQPSGCGGLMVFVCGDLKVDDGEHAVKFSQVFHLMPDASGTNFWVCTLYHDIQ